MPDIVDFEFIRQRRARAYQRHIAHHNVPELRKFVEARLAQEPAYCSYPGIILDFVHRRLSRFLVRTLRLAIDKPLHILLVDLGVVVHVHRAELQAAESRTELAKPLLAEDYRTFGGQLNSQRD